jgi:hypothetical protein
VVPQLSISKTRNQVVVHQPDCLHVGIADGWPDKLEASAEKVSAHLLCFRGACWNLRLTPPRIVQRMTVYKLPDIPVKAPVLFLHGKEAFRVLYRRSDLQTVANDAGVSHQLLNLRIAVLRHPRWIKTVKCPSIVFSLEKNGGPAQSGLGTFQDKELKQNPVIMLWDTPLGVVIADIRLTLGPGAAFLRGHGVLYACSAQIIIDEAHTADLVRSRRAGKKAPSAAVLLHHLQQIMYDRVVVRATA